jgi:hypothetical protein
MAEFGPLRDIWKSGADIIAMAMGAWQGVARDSLKFHSGMPCSTLLRPGSGPP